MCRLENTILFQKYQLCRTIGTGRNGDVYLARHLGLDEFRAVKRVQKNRISRLDYRNEALILKRLRHPGIPIVYDLEEDSEYIYIIEEFLEGESLYALVSRLGHLTGTKVISYGIQICKLLVYLHSAEPNPILFLDLQPKNLILCRGEIKLIDFDQAVTLSKASLLKLRYGTVGFAAPEQYTDSPMDQRTDIYALGALLCFMGTGTFPGEGERVFRESFGRGLSGIVSRCLEPEIANRYESALEVYEALSELQTGVFQEDTSSSLIIALAGSRPGIGTTHIALGLSVYLTAQGYPNLYEERNDTRAVLKLAAQRGVAPDENGIYWLKECAVKPDYGACVRLGPSASRLTIRDYGTDYRRICREDEADRILLVGGCREWEREDTAKAFEAFEGTNGVFLLWNHCPEHFKFKMTGNLAGAAGYRLPYFPDPFCPGQEAGEFYRALWAQLETLVSPERRHFWERWKRGKGKAGKEKRRNNSRR